ncbi:MAG: DUF456 domain-containing protein [Phycisphaerales bacterium]|jgi:hypothetical protein|nr:DUF456 domain-containing protein [Phycisphaerales bacterium]MDP6693138.1 DUF456 domain-containing protein [Phycisphaerales bacterium]
MDWITIVVIILFAFISALCVLLAMLGLAGTWIMVALALGIELLDSYWGDGETWGWTTLGICFGLAIVGEIMEMGAGALGVKVGGGSRRGMIGAIIGGIVGGIALTPFIPIPVIGTLIGAVIGTFSGAIIGEVTHKDPSTVGSIAKSATGATIGRILGVLGKTGTAAVCWCILVVTPFV